MVPPASHRVSRVPWYSGSYLKNYRFNYVAITLYSGAFQLSSSTMTSSLMTCPQPQQSKLHWFGLFRVRSPLLTESNFFLFLRVLRCFSSPGSPHAAMDSLHADRGFLCRVSPFRYLRINGYVLLPEAFRSLSRLSSALSAKASTLRPYYFNRSRNDRIT